VSSALPRRFGDLEPLQGRFADVGVDGFSAAWHDADMLLFFEGSEPFFHGYMSCSDPSVGRIWTMGLACHAGPFGGARWRDALKALFVMLADELPAFYATAQVVRGGKWTGRTVFT
jgi:hypothetical protein